MWAAKPRAKRASGRLGRRGGVQAAQDLHRPQDEKRQGQEAEDRKNEGVGVLARGVEEEIEVVGDVVAHLPDLGEQGSDAVEHLIEGGGQLVDLVASCLDRNPFFKGAS